MNIRKVVSDAGISAISLSLSIVKGLILIPLFTKYLGVSTYGVWVLSITVATVLTSLGGVHLHGALIRYSQTDRDLNLIFSEILLISLFLGTIFSFCGYLLLTLFPDAIHIVKYPILKYLISVFVFIKIVGNVFLNYPRARDNVKQYELLVSTQIFAEVILITAAVFFYNSLPLALAGLLLSWILIIIIVTFVYKPLSYKINTLEMKRYLRYGIPMVPKELGTRILTDADKFLLSIFIGPEAVGFYSAAYSVSASLKNISGVMNSTLYPAVSSEYEKGGKQELTTLYSFIFQWYTLLAIPAVVGITLLAEPLLLVVSTEEVASSWILIPILSFGFFLRGFDDPLSFIILAAERTEINALVKLFAAIVNIILNLILIPYINIIGAAFATLVSQSLIMILITRYSAKIIQLRYRYLYLGYAVIGCLVMSVTVLLLPYSDSLTLLISGSIIGLMTYIATLYIFGWLPIKSTKKMIKSM